MLAQAAGYALLGAISPTALVASSVFLASASPRRTALYFLFGGLLMTLAVGVALFLALRAGGFSRPSEHDPKYGLRLGLGVLALGVGVLLARRKPRPPDPGKKPNLVMRLASRPAPAAAFVVGVLVFTPSITFVAAVQVIATANADVALVVLGLALVVAIEVMFAWLPLLLFLAAPDATTRQLKAIDNSIHEHGRKVLVAAMAIGGLALIASGAVGLAG